MIRLSVACTFQGLQCCQRSKLLMIDLRVHTCPVLGGLTLPLKVILNDRVSLGSRLIDVGRPIILPSLL